VERPITGFHVDEAGDWVAELGCGHCQHVRHRPPFQERPWTSDEAGRRSRLGTPLRCRLCDRGELPDATVVVRASPQWDEATMPAGLRRAHRLAAGTWGVLRVRAGRLRFTQDAGAVAVEVTAGQRRGIPPEVAHEVEPLGPVRFGIEFLAPAPRAERPDDVAEGGDPACWLGEVCPECGAFAGDGFHRPGCPAGPGPDGAGEPG